MSCLALVMCSAPTAPAASRALLARGRGIAPPIASPVRPGTCSSAATPATSSLSAWETTGSSMRGAASSRSGRSPLLLRSFTSGPLPAAVTSIQRLAELNVRTGFEQDPGVAGPRGEAHGHPLVAELLPDPAD